MLKTTASIYPVAFILLSFFPVKKRLISFSVEAFLKLFCSAAVRKHCLYGALGPDFFVIMYIWNRELNHLDLWTGISFA